MDIQMVVGVPQIVRLHCGSKNAITVTWSSDGVAGDDDDPIGEYDEPIWVEINRVEDDCLHDWQDLELVASVSVGPKILCLWFWPGGVAMNKRQGPSWIEDVALHVTVAGATAADATTKHPRHMLNDSPSMKVSQKAAADGDADAGAAADLDPDAPVLTRRDWKELKKVVQAWRRGDVSSSFVIASDFRVTLAEEDAAFWKQEYKYPSHADFVQHAEKLVKLSQEYLEHLKADGNKTHAGHVFDPDAK